MQLLFEVRFVCELYLPALQSVHSVFVCSFAAMYLPAGQSLHAASSLRRDALVDSEYFVPAGQDVIVGQDVAPQEVAVEHVLQVLCPDWSWYSPTEHVLQLICPSWFWY